MSPKASTSSADVALASMAASPRSIGAAEAQLVADDDVAGVGDRMTDDRDFLAAGSGIGWHGEGHTTSSAREASGLRVRFTIS